MKTLEELDQNECFFDANQLEVNYRDVDLLKRFLSTNLKIRPKERTGVCAKHQRDISTAIKKARQAGLLPYDTK
ncbi:MAG: 30S ribosomal protein S18 [Parcubacteria group bacterium QH_9_35_7]|jgi:small subunit ribosomal protein S18|nr:MAG: 30S ribosomal protein S18 [Parcubacteria group bacterium QH_9_35_7]